MVSSCSWLAWADWPMALHIEGSLPERYFAGKASGKDAAFGCELDYTSVQVWCPTPAGRTQKPITFGLFSADYIGDVLSCLSRPVCRSS